MRREDVRPLLHRAVGEVPEPDLADSAWAGGRTMRRRKRRTAAVVLAVVLLMVAAAGVVVSMQGPGAGLTAPDRPPSHPPGYVSPAGQIAGMDFWLAPRSGSEPYLNRLSTPLGERLQYPDDVEALQTQPVEQIAAVVLARSDSGFRPLLLGSDAKWSEADVLLGAIATGSPLSPGSVAPSGARVAFPQPGGVVVVESASAQIRRIALPDQDIRSVSWLADGERMLVSGPRSTYRVTAGSAQEVVAVQPSVDPHAATAPYRLDGVAGQVVLMRSTLRGWTVDDTMQLPVQSWTGQTFTSGNVAARLFTATELSQVPTTASRPQVVAAISAVPSQPSRLLVLGETPQATPPPSGPSTPDAVRERDCCSVLGWYDAGTVLLQVTGWVLSWSLETGQVRRVAEVEVEAVALGPGLQG